MNTEFAHRMDDSDGAAPSRLNDKHAAEIEARGITLETAQKAMLKSVSGRESSNILGFDPKSGGVAIPYAHPETGRFGLFAYVPIVHCR